MQEVINLHDTAIVIFFIHTIYRFIALQTWKLLLKTQLKQF